MSSAAANDDLVRQFFTAFEQCTPGDVEGCLDLCTPDVVFYMYGPDGPALTGRDAVREGLQKMIPAVQNVQVEILNVASNGSVVFVERAENMLFMGKHQIRIYLASVAEVAPDGKFSLWKDYFDPTETRKLAAMSSSLA